MVDLQPNQISIHKITITIINYDAGAYVASRASSLVHNNYDTRAYVASVASGEYRIAGNFR